MLPELIKAKRQARTDKYGSPPYVWTPGAIAAGASTSIEVAQQFPEARKYAPLDWAEVVNLDTVPLTLTINGGSETWIIPANTIRSVANRALWAVALTNNGAAATTAGNITVTMLRQALDVDKAVQRSVRLA